MPDADPTPCLSVVMPCFNESARVERAILAVLDSPWTAEVVVVDDGSSDDTAALAEKVASDDARVRVVRQPCNLGKGAALRRGFREVSAEYVVVQDADLEYDPADWDLLLPPLLDDDADVVYGSRFTAAGPHRVLYYWHSVGNRVLTTLSNMATNINLTDMETCSKVFRREVLESIELTEDRFGFEPEVTAKIARQGWRIYEVGISYRGRTYEEGKKIGWRDGVRAVWCIARYSRPGERVATSLVRPAAPRPAAEPRPLERTEDQADWIVELIAPHLGDRILEVGARAGALTERLAARGSVVVEDALASLAPGEPFDSAVVVDVLEHRHDDVAALREIGACLRPGGALVSVVPAHEWLQSAFDDEVGHHRRYRRAGLAQAYAAAGFEIEELRYLDAAGAVAWLLGTRALGLRPTGTTALARRFEADRTVPFGQHLLAVGRQVAR